jgi:hypothetical protein
VRERSAATDRELVKGYRRALVDYARMVGAVNEQKVENTQLGSLPPM